ncbi:LIM domain transcription factor LMO4.1 [Takifugu flavidus]|uniref:LIM domain transcription factor LMO4.1 n=1 Tax=Takifugu flavidus TaxID=433684 RepID=A0A5C6N2B6_9TELE|nr:LIM domain transcription factor LMO4.1 [Takifugu flavidus]
MVNSQAPGLSPAPRSCAGCGGRIWDRFLLFSMERYWHARCLRCSCCQAQLGDLGPSCYSKGGMILCRSDYLRWGGGPGRRARLGDAVPVCGTPCPSGGRRARLGDALLHALCPHRLFGHGGACRGCSQAIPASEMVMRAQGSVYHLKVREAPGGGDQDGGPARGTRTGDRHGGPARGLTTFLCSSQCFSCATCRVRLVPGDRFHYINGTIFCEQDRPGSVLLSPTVPPLADQKEATASQQDVFSVQCWSLATCTASRARAAAAPPLKDEQEPSVAPELHAVLGCRCLRPECCPETFLQTRRTQPRPPVSVLGAESEASSSDRLQEQLNMSPVSVLLAPGRLNLGHVLWLAPGRLNLGHVLWLAPGRLNLGHVLWLAPGRLNLGHVLWLAPGRLNLGHVLWLAGWEAGSLPLRV